MEIVARAFIGILQNIFRSWAFFSKSKGRILNELRVSFWLLLISCDLSEILESTIFETN